MESSCYNKPSKSRNVASLPSTYPRLNNPTHPSNPAPLRPIPPSPPHPPINHKSNPSQPSPEPPPPQVQQDYSPTLPIYSLRPWTAPPSDYSPPPWIRKRCPFRSRPFEGGSVRRAVASCGLPRGRTFSMSSRLGRAVCGGERGGWSSLSEGGECWSR